jgi:D-alanyl-D-alanine carboxypeptidase
MSIWPTFLLSLLLVAGPQTINPPEVVSHKIGSADFGARNTFRIDPIPAPLLEKIRTSTWHAGCPVSPEDLRQLTLPYWTFDSKPVTGLLIVHKDVAEAVAQIFSSLYHHGFLIEKMAPVEEYHGSDDASMAANNTSAFNCRDVTGQPGKFSNHSWGRAIDINPLTNPYVKGDKVLPPDGRQYLDRTKAFPGSVLADGFAVKQFVKAGWQWGGNWSNPTDYQHFEKPAGN